VIHLYRPPISPTSALIPLVGTGRTSYTDCRNSLTDPDAEKSNLWFSIRERIPPWSGGSRGEETMRYGTGRVWATGVFLLTLLACGGDGNGAPEAAPEPSEPGLTAFQAEHGIGPFTTEVTLDGPVDAELARAGEEIFQLYCESCHMMDERFIGPSLGDVLERRSPTFVLNMIMNPEQMAREHPEGQRMLQEYPLIMPYQNITEEQARALLEYLRTAGD
jgi:cytochrome c